MKEVLSVGQQQAIMGAAGFEQRAAVSSVVSPAEPTPPGVFVNLPDIGQQQEQMGHYGRLAQAANRQKQGNMVQSL